jgi:hypothetical protein
VTTDGAVLVTNAADRPWLVRITAWGGSDCTGPIAADAPKLGLAKDDSVERAVPDPDWGVPYRLGVEIWDASCNEACGDPPIGFIAPVPVPAN